MNHRLGVHHFALLALLVGVAVWVAQRGQATRQDPAAVLDALRAAEGPALPTAAAAGASHRADVEMFDPETLYDFINGAADAYLARGFARCAATVYSFRKTDGGTFEINAEVYRFSAPAGAREQLEAERPPAAHAIPGAGEAWMDGRVLLAVAGVDYIKLTAVDNDPTVEEALLQLLASWRKEGES